MTENENNFESLRRLLALKRHETPPPGYFQHFSRQVVQRIRAGDSGAAAGWAEELFGHAPWLEKFVHVFDMKPAFASAFAGALCLLLFIGIIYAERPDHAALQANITSFGSITPEVTPTVSPEMTQVALQQTAAEPNGIVSSTNPVLSLQPVATLFGQQNPVAQPVSLSVPSN